MLELLAFCVIVGAGVVFPPLGGLMLLVLFAVWWDNREHKETKPKSRIDEMARLDAQMAKQKKEYKEGLQLWFIFVLLSIPYYYFVQG